MDCKCDKVNLILAIAVIVFTYGYGAGWGSWSMWLVYLAAVLIGLHALICKKCKIEVKSTGKRKR